MPKIPSKLKAPRNRIRRHTRKRRLRIESNPSTPATWVRDRFVAGGDRVIGTLFGMPVVEVDDLPDVGELVLGDWARRCRVCGCTDDDCSGCIERTGEPCSWWVELGKPNPDGPICSACAIEEVVQGTGDSSRAASSSSVSGSASGSYAGS